MSVSRRRTLGALIGAALSAAAIGGIATPAQAAPAMLRGFTDLDTIQRNPAERSLALEHLKHARATSLRIMWLWSEVERAKPADRTQARDPDAPIYDFSKLDALLRDLAAAGVTPLLEIHEAPAWWEGPKRPRVSHRVPAGTWRPNPTAYADFMTAVARRYSGSHPDPLRPGETLPRVRHWQLWNEPNLYNFLNPQWVRDGRRWRRVSPRLYKRLLNAGYEAVKSVARDNVVVSAGTAPFAEPWPGGPRMPAAAFWRALLCVDGREHPRARDCRKDPAKFDILAHHPYPIGPPGRKAINPDDVVIPDFPKLQKPLRVALAAGNVHPKRPKRIWATELSWDSRPPDPKGIPAVLQARYLAGTLYVLWRQGVRAMFWWNLRDDVRGHGWEYTLQSGVYLRGKTVAEDRPKPSLQAMRFPFVAYRRWENFRGHGRALLWGMAPRPGPVEIQRRHGERWRTIRRVRAGQDHVFKLRLAAGRGVRLRAVQDGEISVDAKVF